MKGIKINYLSGMFMVPEVFVDKFIKDANPSFVKLYIYILRHSNDAQFLTLEKISEDTGLLQSDVINGLRYWKSCNVLSYGKNDEYDYIDITHPSSTDICKANSPVDRQVVTLNESDDVSNEKKPKNKFPKNSVAASYKASEVLENVSTDKELQHLFSLIQQMLNKSLSANDYKIIYSFIDYLKLPERVILALFEHCISIGKTSMRYIESVAYAWADRGITDVCEAEKFIEETNEKQSLLKKYKRKFKLVGREFSDAEASYIFDWIYNLKAPEKLIMQAFEKTVLNTGKVSVSYMNAIICDEINANNPNEEKASNVKKSSFRNYPENYGISDTEKEMIKKMMSEYNGGAGDNADKK